MNRVRPELPLQERVFCESEADSWYARNAPALGRGDVILQVLSELDRRREIGSIVDLGCTDGWRLAALRPAFPGARRLAGTDPSRAAIEAGRRRWPDLDLEVGTLSNVPFDEPFDLAVVSFVFYLVDRAALARSVAEVDRVVRPGGVLALADFCADEPTRVPYHHRTDVALFSHKQDHAAVFLALGSYRETFGLEYDHDQLRLDSLVSTRRVEPWGRSRISILVKEG